MKTLYRYLGSQLLRVTLLGTAALTLVLTVVLMIEPLRKQGVEPMEALLLFVYMLPVPLSMALPIGALLAASITYGKFAQDRELLACRASGIPIPRVLLPAILLGGVITVVTLTLSNFVSPMMMRKAEDIAMTNLSKLVFHRLRTHGDLDIRGKYRLHATAVDEESDAILGVVAGQYRNVKDARTGESWPVLEVMIASTAYVEAHKDNDTGTYFVSVDLRDPVGPLTSKIGAQVEGKEVPYQNYEIEPPTRDRPALYDWPSLVATLQDPTRHSDVKRDVIKIKRKIAQVRFVKELGETIESGKPYTGLHHEDETFSIYAPVVLARKGIARLGSKRLDDGTLERVSVTIRRGDRERTFLADRGRVTVSYSEVGRNSFVTIELEGNVAVPGKKGQDAARQSLWRRGTIPLPADATLESASLGEIYHNTDEYTDDALLLDEMAMLKQSQPLKVRGKVLAEMHWRMAMGLSTVLLVALGAALGVIFKGGHLLVAFMVSVLPAAAIGLCFFMGSRMIANPDSSDAAGMIAIWGSLAVLLAADLVLYRRLAKQ